MTDCQDEYLYQPKRTTMYVKVHQKTDKELSDTASVVRVLKSGQVFHIQLVRGPFATDELVQSLCGDALKKYTERSISEPNSRVKRKVRGRGDLDRSS